MKTPLYFLCAPETSFFSLALLLDIIFNVTAAIVQLVFFFLFLFVSVTG